MFFLLFRSRFFSKKTTKKTDPAPIQLVLASFACPRSWARRRVMFELVVNLIDARLIFLRVVVACILRTLRHLLRQLPVTEPRDVPLRLVSRGYGMCIYKSTSPPPSLIHWFHHTNQWTAAWWWQTHLLSFYWMTSSLFCCSFVVCSC